MAFSIALSQLVDLGAVGIAGYPFTLCGWFRVPNVNKLLTLMGVGNTVTGSYHRLLFQGHTTSHAAAISFVSATSSAVSATAMVPGTWHHVVGVFEATNSRRIYLDGGHVGTNFASRTFDGANQFYLGSLGTDAIEVAEAAVFDVAVSSNQVALLAQGFSPLCLPAVDNLLAYQSCLRRLNWPSFGPTAVAAASPTVVSHPRLFWRRNRGSRVQPYRLRGPFLSEKGLLQVAGTVVAQPYWAGIVEQGGQAYEAGIAAGEAKFLGEAPS